MAWVERRGDRWRVQYYGPDGKKKTLCLADTEAKAKKAALAQELAAEDGTWLDPNAGKITFSDYFENQWLPNRFLEKTTIDVYECHYRTALKEAFGTMEIRRITRGVVQRWVGGLARGGMSGRSIEAKYKVLSVCLGGERGISAVRDGLIATNPCAGVDLPTWRGPEKNKVVYTVTEVDTLMKVIDEWWRPIPMMAADTGLRWGELMGLLVCDLDFEELVITVRHTIVELKKSKTGNGTRYLSKPWPKNRKTRKAGMTQEMADYLIAMIKQRKLFPADRLFSTPDKDGEVIRTPEWPTGLPVSRAFFRDSVWLPAHKESGVPRMVVGDDGEYTRKFHSLRGSHITWLLDAGVEMAVVQAQVGHGRESTTQDYKGSMMDGPARAAAGIEAARRRGRA